MNKTGLKQPSNRQPPQPASILQLHIRQKKSIRNGHLFSLPESDYLSYNLLTTFLQKSICSAIRVPNALLSL